MAAKKVDLSSSPLIRKFGPTFILIAVAIVAFLIITAFTVRIGRVTGEQVGIKLNKFTGGVNRVGPGKHFYSGIVSAFYVLDKTEQQLEMVAEAGRGQVHGNDELTFKTVDGSNVRLDLNVFYKLSMEKGAVERLVQETGPGELYKRKWMRDYVRSICRDHFGELTTEQFYEAGLRAEKADQALAELNRRLNPRGLIVTAVNPEAFRFHEEYEKKILEKKLADQEVEEQESRARAATQQMERMRVEATKEKEVAIEKAKGAMRELIVEAEAEAQRTREEADAYAIRTRIGADARFIKDDKGAQATLARAKAEAEGVAKMASALAGEGGRNLVKMEYASKLRTMSISGQPYTISAETKRLTHTEESVPARPPADLNTGRKGGDVQ